MEYFVPEDSIVRRIWGKSDTILFIFSGASAEFALNKAVDWLYFTGRLPADPLGRLFSTVKYARQIVFAPKAKAEQAIDSIVAIHRAVEESRGDVIPDWAYRDVLFMLIHYSMASFELLERKLTKEEKEESYSVFLRIGERMKLKELPRNYNDWLVARETHLRNDLVKSNFTTDLFLQYKKHLGTTRFKILKEAQLLVIPPIVRRLLGMRSWSWLRPAVPLYKLSRVLKADNLIRKALLPPAYYDQVIALDRVNG